MTIDKQKVSAAAQKYIRKGAYDKAIRELQKLIEADPDDVRTLLKIGNLHSRKGDDAAAVEVYLRVAGQYRDGGFHQKAVAVYKQVAKLQPQRIDVHEALGSVYQAQGLTREALHSFRIVLDHARETEDQEAMLQVLGSMCQLDQDNVSLRTRYADQLARTGKVTLAVQHFSYALRLLRTSNRHDDFIKVAERLLYFDPDHANTLRAVVRAYLDSGQTRQALAKLQKLYAANPREIETLELLSKTFEALQQTAKTVQVLKELGRLYLGERGDNAMAEDAWQRAYELSPDDPEILEALGYDADMPLLDDSMIEALEPEPLPEVELEPAQMTPEQRAEEVERLLTECDVCLRYNLLDQAREHLDRLDVLAPDNLDTMERRALLYSAERRTDEAVILYVAVARGTWNTDKDHALRLVAEVAKLDPNSNDAFELVLSWGLDPSTFGLVKKVSPDLTETPERPLASIDAIQMPPPLPPRRTPSPSANGRTTRPQALDVEAVRPIGDARPRPTFQTLPADAFDLLEDVDMVEVEDDALVEDDEVFELDDFEVALDQSIQSVDIQSFGDESGEFSSLFDIDDDDIDSLFGAGLLSGPGDDSGISSLDPFAPSSASLPIVQGEPDPPAPRALSIQELTALLEELAEAEFFVQQGLDDDAREMLEDLRARYGDDRRILAALEKVT